jgi:hypothetical protein
MCECLCSNVRGEQILTVGSATVAIDPYFGCKECADLIGIDVRIFNAKGRADFLDGNKGEIVTPHEYGHPGATSYCNEMFSIDDLASAFAEMVDAEVISMYEPRELIREFGLEMIQRGARLCAKRKRAKEESNAN